MIELRNDMQHDLRIAREHLFPNESQTKMVQTLAQVDESEPPIELNLKIYQEFQPKAFEIE